VRPSFRQLLPVPDQFVLQRSRPDSHQWTLSSAQPPITQIRLVLHVPSAPVSPESADQQTGRAGGRCRDQAQSVGVPAAFADLLRAGRAFSAEVITFGHADRSFLLSQLACLRAGIRDLDLERYLEASGARCDGNVECLLDVLELERPRDIGMDDVRVCQNIGLGAGQDIAACVSSRDSRN
jgi:hypothetical protein